MLRALALSSVLGRDGRPGAGGDEVAAPARQPDRSLRQSRRRTLRQHRARGCSLPRSVPRIGGIGHPAPKAEAGCPCAAVAAQCRRHLRRQRLTRPEGALASSLRPSRAHAPDETVAALAASAPAAGLDLSSNPDGKDVDLAAVAPPTAKEQRKKKREAASMKGSVCGVPAIKGTEIKRRSPRRSRAAAWKSRSPSPRSRGCRLSQTATVDCSIAKALNSWVDEVAQPAFDGKLVEMQVAAHYICRSRNNIKGAKISEHGKGRAIDISAFVLSNGKVLTVAEQLQQADAPASTRRPARISSTTLGPGSDGYHEDHFHFDTSARSGGSYCR